jgi:hypothetical protein
MTDDLRPLPPRQPTAAPPGILRRLFWLLACLGTGVGIGLAGYAWSGEAMWFVAVPAVLAAGWLVIADPSRCTASAACRQDDPPKPK